MAEDCTFFAFLLAGVAVCRRASEIYCLFILRPGTCMVSNYCVAGKIFVIIMLWAQIMGISARTTTRYCDRCSKEEERVAGRQLFLLQYRGKEGREREGLKF